MQDAEKSEFREYLESAGSENALWKILIKMDRMEPKPDDPIEYIRQNLDPKLTKNLADLQDQVNVKVEELVQLAYENPKACKKFLKWKIKTSKKARKGKRCDKLIINKIKAFQNPVEVIPEAPEAPIEKNETEEVTPIDETPTEQVIPDVNVTEKIEENNEVDEKKAADELKPDTKSNETILEEGSPNLESNEKPTSKSDEQTPQEINDQNENVILQEKPEESMHIEGSQIEPDLIEKSNEEAIHAESPTKTMSEALPPEASEPDENDSEKPKSKWLCCS